MCGGKLGFYSSPAKTSPTRSAKTLPSLHPNVLVGFRIPRIVFIASSAKPKNGTIIVPKQTNHFFLLLSAVKQGGRGREENKRSTDTPEFYPVQKRYYYLLLYFFDFGDLGGVHLTNAPRRRRDLLCRSGYVMRGTKPAFHPLPLPLPGLQRLLSSPASH